MAKSGRKRKLRLWNKNPHCHWCGVLTVVVPVNEKGKIPGGPPLNMATIDHLRPRYDPFRREPMRFGKNEQRIVLACWRCNNERDQRDYNALPLEQRNAMSGTRASIESLVDAVARAAERPSGLWSRSRPG